MSQANDADLMSRVRGGDRDAFGVLVERYQHVMVNYLCRLTGSRDRAEELAQETFLRLYQAAPRYSEQGRLAPYIYRIATNLVRSEDRHARRFKLFAVQVNGHQPAPTPQALLLAAEVKERLRSTLAELPLKYRVPVVLHEIEGLSCAEIGRLLGCREGTVKSRLSRGRARLRQGMSPYWNGHRKGNGDG